MNTARTNFGLASGPDKDATGTVQGLDSDPRVYAMGGIGAGGALASCEKYNPNTDAWEAIASLPVPLPNSSAAFVPDYGANTAINLGYIYVVGGGVDRIYRYDIKQDTWDDFPLPIAPVNATLAYMDDIGGPLASLFIAVTDFDLPPCTDTQTLWIVGGEGTEQEVWYIQSNVNGVLVGDWARAPDLPLKRSKPLIGRVFWRDAGITSFGVSNCASIIVAGGVDGAQVSKDVQILVRDSDCNWSWVYAGNNPTELPNDVLTLAVPVENGAFGTEQWPETLATGGRAMLFGGEPTIENEGSVQFAQLRFFEGRYQRDQCLAPQPNDTQTAWNTTTRMPGPRTALKAAPLSQENSSFFGGRRVSRFLCVGGESSEDGSILARAQLFELPVPSAFTVLRRNLNRCPAKESDDIGGNSVEEEQDVDDEQQKSCCHVQCNRRYGRLKRFR